MRKVILFCLVFVFGILFAFQPLVHAETLPRETEEAVSEENLTIYFFDDRLCSVCRDTKNFLQRAVENRSDLELVIYPINDTDKLREIALEHDVRNYRVMAPTIFIGENFLQFTDFTSREVEILTRAIEGEVVDDESFIVRIPILNREIDIGGWSLPIIAIVLGSIDGFNVCSIGALILILSIVFIFDSKKKIFFFGGLFILTTVVVYGGLVFIFGRVFEALIGHLEILRIIVGLASLAGGVYFFKEFWRFYKYGPTCSSSTSPLVANATKKLKKAFENPKRGTILLAGSVVSFATAITIVELPCSVGIPIAFTGILVEAGASLTEHIGYILLYLFMYMLIEIIIFTGAVVTKKIWFAGSKAVTWISFLGAMVLFYLAFYYLLS
jgi:hypothetical protein